MGVSIMASVSFRCRDKQFYFEEAIPPTQINNGICYFSTRSHTKYLDEGDLGATFPSIILVGVSLMVLPSFDNS